MFTALKKEQGGGCVFLKKKMEDAWFLKWELGFPKE